MFKFGLIFLLFCQAAFASTADQRLTTKTIKEFNLKAELRTLGDISRKEAAKLKLEFYDSKSKNRTAVKLDAIPDVSLWMEMESGKGHGSEKLKIVQEGSSYIISNAWFMMMGDWQLKTKLSFNGKTELISFPICIGKKPVNSHVGACK